MSTIIVNSTPLNNSIKTNHRLNNKIHYYTKILATFFVLLIFVSSIVFFGWSLFVQPKKVQKTQANIKREILKQIRFNKIEEIPFVIRSINNIKTNGQTLFHHLQEINPQIDKKTIRDELNRQILTFYALNNFYKQSIEFPNDYQLLLEKNNQLINRYNKNVFEYTGYFIKIRFSGYYKERYNQIKDRFKDEDLRALAYEKITDIVNNKTDPELLFPSLNNDETISLLNNNEKAIDYFEDETFETELFDDPDFYQYLARAPINRYSPIYILNTKNPYNRDFEEYAFLVFYLKEKKGTYESLNEQIKKILNEKTYR